MIQPVSQHYHSVSNNLSNVSFKNNGEINKTLPQRKWFEIDAKGNTIEKQRRNYSIALCTQTVIIIGLLGVIFSGKSSDLFSRFKKFNLNSFKSLKNDKNIPNIKECKSLNKNLKETLERQVNLAKVSKDTLTEFGDDIGSSNRFLLYGPPGTGKSFFAKVYAKSINAEYLEVLFSDLNSRWVGETEKNMKNMFETALKAGKKNPEKKYVLTFNEIDSLVVPPDNLSKSKGTHWVSVLRQRSIFLNYLEMLKEKSPNVTIIGTTNIIPKNNGLDRAAMSRFQNLIELTYPDKDCLYEALKTNLGKFKAAKDALENEEQLLKLSNTMAKRKFSFRNLDNILKEAKESYINERIKGNNDKFNIKYLQKSIDNLKISDGELEKI